MALIQPRTSRLLGNVSSQSQGEATQSHTGCQGQRLKTPLVSWAGPSWGRAEGNNHIWSQPQGTGRQAGPGQKTIWASLYHYGGSAQQDGEGGVADVAERTKAPCEDCAGRASAEGAGQDLHMGHLDHMAPLPLSPSLPPSPGRTRAQVHTRAHTHTDTLSSDNKSSRVSSKLPGPWLMSCCLRVLRMIPGVCPGWSVPQDRPCAHIIQSELDQPKPILRQGSRQSWTACSQGGQSSRDPPPQLMTAASEAPGCWADHLAQASWGCDGKGQDGMWRGRARQPRGRWLLDQRVKRCPRTPPTQLRAPKHLLSSEDLLFRKK